MIRFPHDLSASPLVKREPNQPPVVDLIWFHEDYMNLFAASDLDVAGYCTPLGRKR
ncbi:MAG TPA: hypothetical protein VJA94_01625 [Candidatus Angelobacter sp.]